MPAEILPMAPWAVAAVAIIVTLLQGFAHRRGIKRLEQNFKDRCDDLGRELHATTSGSLGVGQRIVACERQVHELRGALDEMRQNDPLRVSYDEASRLVDLGAEVEDLMNTCGISRPEAELVSALRRRRAA